MKETYIDIVGELERRITALMPEHQQEILGIGSPFDLHKITGFHCDDLNPSLFQAHVALARACKKWREANNIGPEWDQMS